MLENSLLDAHRRIDRALDYMRDHLAQPFQLQKLASVAAVSPDYFIRVFKNVMGMTPGRYFRREKLLEIDRRLQADPEANLTDLAFEFGYSSSSVLTREYKTFLGTLPRACKTLLQRKEIEARKSMDDKMASVNDK